METRLADVPVTHKFRLGDKEMEVISKGHEFDEEKIPQGGIRFGENPGFMTVVVKETKTLVQRKLSGDKIVNYERRSKSKRY